MIPLLVAFLSGAAAGAAGNYVTGMLSRRRNDVRQALDSLNGEIVSLMQVATSYWATDYSNPHPGKEEYEQVLAEVRILSGFKRVSLALGALCERYDEFLACRDQLAQFNKAMTNSDMFRSARRPAEPERLNWVQNTGDGLRGMLESCYEKKFRFHI